VHHRSGSRRHASANAISPVFFRPRFGRAEGGREPSWPVGQDAACRASDCLLPHQEGLDRGCRCTSGLHRGAQLIRRAFEFARPVADVVVPRYVDAQQIGRSLVLVSSHGLLLQRGFGNTSLRSSARNNASAARYRLSRLAHCHVGKLTRCSSASQAAAPGGSHGRIAPPMNRQPGEDVPEGETMTIDFAVRSARFRRTFSSLARFKYGPVVPGSARFLSEWSDRGEAWSSVCWRTGSAAEDPSGSPFVHGSQPGRSEGSNASARGDP